MLHPVRVLCLGAALVATSGCAGMMRTAIPTPPREGTLWIDPVDIGSRDLFWGPWGAEHAPDPDDTYTLVELKHTGVNPGMTVVDSRGTEWSVKQAYPGEHESEAPVEVALSRLLSGVGYHQPPVYFMRTFTLRDHWGTHTERGGRFRPKVEGFKEIGSWEWDESPHAGTTPQQGLLVLLMMFNSTDLKATNNSVYEYRHDGRVEHWFVTRDLGAALGDINRVAPLKNHPDAFEQTPFLRTAGPQYVEFAYNSWYRKLVRDTISRDHVVWASNLLSRLSDRQWQDAFRAGGYDPAAANRFIRRLREKIAEGQSLAHSPERTVSRRQSRLGAHEAS